MQAKLTDFHKYVSKNKKGDIYGVYYRPFQHDQEHERLLIEAYREYLETIGHSKAEHLKTK